MASLSFLLGMIPGTGKVEAADDKLRADYQAYKDYENSEELRHYQDLEKEVKSSDFALRKKKLKKSEYKDSDEYQKRTEYDVLRKSEKVQWYFKTKKKYPFKEIERWDLTFDEKFDESKLDKSKWMTQYYWGEKGVDEAFAMEDDKSFPTDGKNIEFYDNKARIVTKPGKAEGLVWRADQGFVREDFDFTSGMISTAKSFKQKYGVFNAKIKMAGGSVAQAFWMLSSTVLPHIDVARYENGKLYSNYFWGKSSSPNKSLSKTGGAKYADEFFIYTLEWTPNKLTWKINGKVFKTQTSGVPQEEMYINFSSNLKKDAAENGLPCAMEIDWVRVYKLKAK
jgi:beta-glucanase (GH16 family)